MPRKHPLIIADMSTIVLAQQKFIPSIMPGDLVAVGDSRQVTIGVFKGYGKAGNWQIDHGWTKIRGVQTNHVNRIVKIHIEDLPLDDQLHFQKIINKYKAPHGTVN